MRNPAKYLATIPHAQLIAAHAVFDPVDCNFKAMLEAAYEAGYSDAEELFRDWKIMQFEQILSRIVPCEPKPSWWRKMFKRWLKIDY